MSDEPNAQEKAFWSGPSGLGWIDFEDVLDTLFQPVTDLILDRSELNNNESVLDIGCGTGAHSISAAQRLGANGYVLATDISEPLLRRTKERAENINTKLDVQLADAQTFGFETETIDLATSRFGVMFFADPAVAFANIAKGIVRGGRMVFGTWAPVRDNPWWYLPSGVTKELLGEMPKVAPNSPGPMGLANIDFVAAELSKSKIGRFDVTPLDVELSHPGGAEIVGNMMVSVGSAGRALRHFNADEAQTNAVAEGILSALSPFNVADGLRMPAKINLIRIDVP